MPKTPSGPLRMGIGPAKGRLTTTLGKAMAIVQQPEPTLPEPRQKMVTEILDTLPRMESQIATLTEINDRWMELIADLSLAADVAAEETLYETTAYGDGGFMHIVLEAKEVTHLLQTRIRRLDKPRVEVTTSPVVSQDNATASQQQPPATKQIAKLPKLELPKFKGDYLEWDGFWQLFRVNIHESNLSKIEKFAYLRSLLDITARSPIEGVAMTEQNYEVAVTMLKARYERPPKQLVASYYSQLKRLPISSTKVSDLQCTYDACERIFRLLEESGEELNTNQSLVFDLFSKFPSQVLEQLFIHRDVSSTSNLLQVRKALSEHIKDAESLSEIFEDLKPFVNTKFDTRSDSNAKKYTPSSATVSSTHTSALTTTSDKPTGSSTDERPKSSCYFCNEDHFNAQCPNYKTVDQRKEKLKALGRCERCLSTTHPTTGCKTPARTIRCFFCKTSGDHRSALCPTKFGIQATTLVAKEVVTDSHVPLEDGESKNEVSATMLNSGETSLLLTATTTIMHPQLGHHIQARILLDSGSHRTYVTDKCAKMLQLTTDKEDIVNIAVFGTKRTLTVKSHAVEFRVVLRDGSTKSLHANTTPVITGGSVLPDRLPAVVHNWLGAMKHELADDYTVNPGHVDILVGCDYFWEFITGANITTNFGIHLLPSSLGILLSGKYKDDSDKQLGNTSLVCLTEKTPSVQIGLAALENRQISKVPDIEEFWELEKVGIHDSPHEDDDARALDQFNKSIYLSEGRYQVQWPWKADVAELPTNYQLAIGRLRSLEKRLKGDKGDLKAKYQAVIDDQLAKGVIEKVTSTCSPEHPVHYIPHHPIIRPTSTTTKVRIVYDASAKSRREAKSLNECLYRGPVMLPDLCAVLIRFRLNPIALVSDIEKAFLQMALQPKDRDVTRFLWFKDPDAPFSLDNMMTLRFCRVPFGVISSPFLLRGTVQYHLASWNNKADLKSDIKETTAEKIAKDIYVDNVSSTVTTSEEAITFYTEAKHIFNSAGMNLTEWCSNMPEFEAVIPHADRSSNRTVKVLGMKWDSERDTMYLSNTASHNATATTKRQILRCVASVFDPLGLFQPATLAAKCLLRDLWLSNRGWDEALDEAEEARWATVKASLSSLGDIRLPRQTGVVDQKSMLVVFCDASADAYATAVYLRSSTDAGTTYKSNLIFAKSRLSPRTRSIEKVSIPRLELLGVVIGCRAAKFCRQSLGCKNLPIVLFTDSSCVLTWLTTSKLLSTFVSNRIQEIKSAGISEFRHVSSSDNPADLCTRGVTGSEMATCHLWWHGPAWIGKPVIQWPVSSVASSTLDSVNASVESECKKGAVFHTILAGEDHGEHEESRNLLNVDPETYSTMSRLMRVTTRILKFIKLKLWNHVPLTTQVRFPTLQKLFDGTFEGCHPTAKDINVAKQLWVKRAQVDVYSDVFAAIRSGKRHYLIRQLNLTVDDTGFLRCAGRFDYAETSPQILRPVLLPKKHPITSLVVQQCHGVLFHAGVAHTLSQIRRQYWIPCGRASVRREVTKCLPSEDQSAIFIQSSCLQCCLKTDRTNMLI